MTSPADQGLGAADSPSPAPPGPVGAPGSAGSPGSAGTGGSAGPPQPPVRVLVADDHELVRRGLELAISAAPGMTVCGSAPDGVEAVRQALDRHPDVVVLDVSMPGGDGLTAARELRRLLPAVRIVVLTWMATSRQAALDAGADLFVLKDVAPTVLVERLRALGTHS